MPTETAADDLGNLHPAITKVEFKYTLLPEDMTKVEAVLPGSPAEGKVYFYDTTDLDLDKANVVLRARVKKSEDDDSTVKLRPVALDDDAAWRQVRGVRIELDVVGEQTKRSAKLDQDPVAGDIKAVAKKSARVDSLFDVDQQRLFELYAPDGISLKKLEVMGSVAARNWELEDLLGFPHKLDVEEWTLPNGERFLELSFKVSHDKAKKAQKAFETLLADLRVDSTGDPRQKTRRVLDFFAERLKKS